MTSFQDRLLAGRQGQRILMQELQARGFKVIETGQEAWLMQTLHEALRHNHTDLMVREIRYQEEFLYYDHELP